MAAFTYPGVYIEELSSGQHTITGVATSIGAFIGWAKMGPVDQATLVQSWSDFQTIFGGLDSRSWLGYAVNQFFANGGNECYIVRLAWDGTLPGGLNNPVACATAVADGVGYGLANVTATLGDVVGTMTLGIGTPALSSVTVLPTNLSPSTAPVALSLPPLPVSATLALNAYGTYSDGSTGSSPLSGVTWQSSNLAIAKVAGNGTVTGVGVPAGTTGPATVTITALAGPSNLVVGSIVLSVTKAAFNSITISPATITTAVGDVMQLAASATYADTTTVDITSLVGWNCSAVTFGPSTATATTPALGVGQFYAAATGSGTVTAPLPSAWTFPTAPTANNGTVTVGAAQATGLMLTPANMTVPEQVAGTAITPPTLSVAGVYPNNVAGAALTPIAWTSSDTGVATVDPSLGTITIKGVGTTTIMATYTPAAGAPLVATTTFTVTSGNVTELVLTPATVTLAGGESQQLTATGIVEGGTSVDMTGYASWTVTPAASPVTVSDGLLTANKGITAASSFTVSAAWEGLTATAPVNVTVTPPVPVSIIINGGPDITPGSNLTLSLTVNLSDGTQSTTTPNSAAAWTTTTPQLTSIVSPGVVTSAAPGGSLTLFAANPGIWGNSLLVSITASANSPSRFGLQVLQVGTSGQTTTLESYVNLSVLSTDPSYVVAVINNDSNYITFTIPGTQTNVVPTATPFATAAPVPFSGGADGTVLMPNDGNFELALAESETAGYQLLDRVDIFNLLCVPGESTPSTISNLQAYCMTKRAFYIVDSPQYATISGLIGSGPVGSSPGSITGTNANYSAFYFPWVQAPDPLVGNRPALFPPCGFVAGIYAATDASRGVWKAPAGIAASLTGNSGLQYVITEDENGSLNPQAVNCIRQFKVYGDVVWGARTLDGNDQQGSQWKYVPIRRLALYIESSLYDGTQWVVFEPNDETLWGQVRLNVGTFMQGLFLQGAFAGTTPQQAYFVKCDGENNPAASVALGVVNILVGFAPVYPAEFVLIEIQQIVANS